jgi:hypothetical protein
MSSCMVVERGMPGSLSLPGAQRAAAELADRVCGAGRAFLNLNVTDAGRSPNLWIGDQSGVDFSGDPTHHERDRLHVSADNSRSRLAAAITN